MFDTAKEHLINIAALARCKGAGKTRQLPQQFVTVRGKPVRRLGGLASARFTGLNPQC
jgi:hypothetical protein